MNVNAAALGLTNRVITRNTPRHGAGWYMKSFPAVPAAMGVTSKSRRILKMKKFAKTALMYLVLTAVMIAVASVDWWVNLI